MRRIIFLLLLFSNCVSAQSWGSLGLGANFNVNALYSDSTNLLYVGGSFDEVDGMPCTSIAVWDSMQWTTFGNNAIINGPIESIIRFNGDLIIGGNFDTINNVAISRIAKWDGSNWQQMGDGFNSDVYTLREFNGQLYAGGRFTQSGVNSLTYFSKWNGSSWISLGVFDLPVFSMTIYQQNLIVAGQFKRIDGIQYGSIAAWNDTVWIHIGTGFNNEVFGVKTIDDTLYACGSFTTIPQTPINFFCKFDGFGWIQMPYSIGFTDWLIDVEKYNGRLFACGNMDNPDDLGIINNGQLDSIGSTNGFIGEMIVYKNQLYVGGNFTTIGNLSANMIARFDDSSTNGIHELMENNLVIYPNPATSNSMLKFKGLTTNKVLKCHLSTMIGQNLVSFNLNNNEVNLSDFSLSSGVYLLTISGENKIAKIIITQ